jgi:hypothetical protein
MRRKKSKIPIVIGAAVVVVVGAVVINSNKSKKVDYSSMSDEELQVAVQEKIDEMEVNNLAGMGERDRMEYYVSSFVKAVENGEYEDAYNMLYEDFRKNYFPTLSSFEEYAKSKFPTNFERNGDVYVLWVTLSNPLGSKDSGIEMNFVVQENDLNDFVMSFTVI